ncbi:AAA family ATPase [Mumia zhuanghuii]|uniref:AAA family ATPase n=2 Tax=Mumia TaxID=1546255 RepID=A0ABW1QMP8_9ACTN|nr:MULTISPECIES: LuxR family transcriptional regulator [Mumia]KAA1419871.1 AAA family ATPase [Mumia zhuanghuii]
MGQPDGRLFGRDAQLDAWSTARTATDAERGACLAFVGPAGVGKTALLDAGRARIPGAVVLRAVGDRVNVDLPGYALWQLLGRTAQATSPGEAPFDGPAARFHESLLGGPPEADPAVLRYAVAWVLRSLAASGPLLVVVDDVQWCDPVSSTVLAGIPALLADDPVVLAFASREPSADLEPAMLTLLESGSVLRSDVAPLNRPDIAAWVRSTGLPATRETVDLVAAASGGLPFAAAECLRELAAGRAVERRGADSDVASRLVAERVRALDPGVREVLAAIVCMGDGVEEEHLLVVTKMSPVQLETTYAVLRGARLLGVAHPPAPAHPIVSDVVRDVLGTAEVAGLHARIAAAYAADGLPVAARAAHLLRTEPGSSSDVATVLLAAAVDAAAAGSAELARRLCRRALAEDGLPTDLAAQLHDVAAQASVLTGDLDAAVEHWSVHTPSDPTVRARRLVDLGTVHYQAGRLVEAEAMYGRALDLLPDGDAERSAVLARIAGLGFHQGRTAVARDVQVAAVLARDPRDDEPADALLLCQEAYRMVIAGEDSRTAGDLALRATQDVEAIDYEQGDGAGYVMGLAALVDSERDSEALALLDRSVSQALARGSVLNRANNLYHRGYLHFERGRLRRARTDLETCVDAAAYGWRAYVNPARCVLGSAYVAMGETAAAEKLASRIDDDPTTPPLLQATDAHLRGVVDAAAGRHEEALASFVRAMELSEGYRSPGYQAWHRAAILAATEVGRLDLARHVADEILDDARRFGAPRSLGLTLVAASAPQPFEDAVRMLREALVLLGRTEAKAYQADALARLATLLAAHAEGDPERLDEATDLARRGRAIAERIGAARIVDAVRPLTVDAPTDVDESAPQRSRIDRLSPAELSVCELAAGGLTNREVAARLFLSIKTVEWHLSSSYAKLRIRSRKELAGQLFADAPSAATAGS